MFTATVTSVIRISPAFEWRLSMLTIYCTLFYLSKLNKNTEAKDGLIAFHWRRLLRTLFRLHAQWSPAKTHKRKTKFRAVGQNNLSNFGIRPSNKYSCNDMLKLVHWFQKKIQYFFLSILAPVAISCNGLKLFIHAGSVVSAESMSRDRDVVFAVFSSNGHVAICQDYTSISGDNLLRNFSTGFDIGSVVWTEDFFSVFLILVAILSNRA